MIRVASAVIVAAHLWALTAMAADNVGETIEQRLDAADGALDDGGGYEAIGSLDDLDETVAEQEFGPWDLWIANTHHVKIELVDGVKEGCWANTSSAKNAVELTLREHGIETNPEDTPSIYLILSAFGGKTDSDKCAVAVSVQVLHYVEIARPKWFSYTDNSDHNFWRLTEVFMRKNLLTGPPGGMSNIIKIYAVDQTKTLLLDIYKTRERLSQKIIN